MISSNGPIVSNGIISQIRSYLARYAEKVVNVAAFGVVTDTGADQTAAFQDAIDSLGDLTEMRGGVLVMPPGVINVSTLVADRKCLWLRGSGSFSADGGGTVLKSNGVLNSSMLEVRRSQAMHIEGVRFIPNPANNVYGINFIYTAGDAPPNSFNLLEKLWFGQFPLDAQGLAAGFIKCILTSGFNAQNDQSVLRDTYFQNYIDAAVDLALSQNTVWHIDRVGFNNGEYAVRNASRSVKMSNVTLSTITKAGVELISDAGVSIENFSMEGTLRLCKSVSASSLVLKNGYFQANKAMMDAAGDYNAVDVSTLGFSFITENFQVTQSGVFAAGQIKFKIRSTELQATHIATSFPDGLIGAHFDYDRNAAGGAGQTINVTYGKNCFQNLVADTDADHPNDIIGDRYDFQGLIALKGLTTATRQLRWGPTGSPFDTTFPGTPEGGVVAPIGSTCRDTTNGDLYIKTSGAGNVGWVLAFLQSDTPTGTGLAKVTAGTFDAASSLLVNADVNVAAAIAGTKVSPDFGTQNVTTTGRALLGAAPRHTFALVAAPNGVTVVGARNIGNTADITLAGTSGNIATYGYGASKAKFGTDVELEAGTDLLLPRDIIFGGTGPTVKFGAGAPGHTPPDGSLYMRTDGLAVTTLYVRAAGAWTALS